MGEIVLNLPEVLFVGAPDPNLPVNHFVILKPASVLQATSPLHSALTVFLSFFELPDVLRLILQSKKCAFAVH